MGWLRQRAVSPIPRVVAIQSGQAVGAESEFVTHAAGCAREYRDLHLPHVAVDADTVVVGMAWLALTTRVAKVSDLDRWSGDLQPRYVVPEVGNAGVGGVLVQAVLATARARGAEHVTVHAAPKSARMYGRHGFRTSARLLWADARIKER